MLLHISLNLFYSSINIHFGESNVVKTEYLIGKYLGFTYYHKIVLN